jgi:polyketide biosynthesis enoyl-CoA hydratase PksI
MSSNEDSDPVGLSVDAEGVAHLSMNDAAGQNRFSRAFVSALQSRFAEIELDTRIKVVVITGLDDVFCAGGDKDVLTSLADGSIAPYDLDLTRALLEVPVPTIAAMKGHAIGGGLIFGFSCDIVFMSERSRYGCNFMDLGFTPGMGTTRLLQAAVGDYLAAEMMFGAQYFKGRHFVGRGNVNDVLPKADVEARAFDVAARIADKPRKAIVLLKRSLGLDRRKAFEEARTLESFMHEITFRDPETVERIRANYSDGDSGSDA